MLIDLRAEARAHKPLVAHLPHLAGCARATWLGRMVNEYTSASVFDAIAVQIKGAGLEAAHVEACRTFAEEERHHGVLCGAVVEALGGQARAPARQQGPLPVHADATALEGVIRNVLSVSCLAETVAVSLIGAERLEMKEGPLRELLTRIWADEVGHARFGWKLVAGLLPAMSDPERRRLSVYLAVAFAHLERHELAHLPTTAAPPPEGAELGLCSGREARALFYATVQQVIVPQLKALGLEAGRAWASRPALS